MSKLTKSLSELDAMADEILAKSQKTEEVAETEELEKSEATEKEEDLKPEDVSENVPDEEVQDAGDEEAESKEEKADDEEEIEKSLKSDEEDIVNEDNEEEKEDLEKSFKNSFESHEEIKKSIDASEFLSAVTEVLSKSLADVVYSMKGSSQQSSDSNEILAKSLQASLNLDKAMSLELESVKSQNEELKKSISEGFNSIREYISEQLEEFSHQPATMRKSVSSVSVHERNFHKSLSGQSGEENLSKSEVLAKLNAYMYSGNPLVQPSDIISYESGAPLRPEVAQLIRSNM